MEKKEAKISGEKIIRYLLCIGMVFLMCFIAEVSEEKEIIFPEIAALVTGAWLVPKFPWNVSRLRMFILMTLAAFMGITVVRFVPDVMPVKLIIGFIFAAFCLILSSTSIYPMISAGILPIMMNTESIIYPLSVCVMTGIIALVSFIMEKKGMNRKLEYSYGKPDIKSSSVHWFKLLLMLISILSLCAVTREYLILAPPLIVTLVEFSTSVKSKKPLMTGICISACAITGFGARCLMEFCNVPIWLCACLVMIMLFIIFGVTKRIFPPAGAIALLPLIIPAENIFTYPVDVITDCILVIGLNMLFMRDKN